jgi:asparagine synthase (glutamine-hydrolysing)
MCGLAGYWAPRRLQAAPEITLQQMGNAIAHRGSNDAGIWCHDRRALGFAHRRLSIVDLSAAGHQPMTSSSGRYVMVFNGEIYNHRRLRRALESASNEPLSWRGHSDTETLLMCLERWGLKRTLQATIGMFALAIWDEQEHALHVARDRFGEKPLYLGFQNGVLLFGSELKALRAHEAFAGRLDRLALAQYLRTGSVPAPSSIYAGVQQVPPGTYMTFTAGLIDVQQLPHPMAYWSLLQEAARGQKEPFSGTVHDAVNALDIQLRRAVKDQQVADVPLGAFLSGGIDSSMIVALMQAESSQRVRTFTIGFTEDAYDEARYARAVANYLGTTHTEYHATPQDALRIIPDLPIIYDEPFADVSQIPTLLVSRLARQDVTVALSGDAGDELFGGYNRYRGAPALWRMRSSIPRWLLPLVQHSASWLTPDQIGACGRLVMPYLPRSFRIAQPAEKWRKMAGLLAVHQPSDLYTALRDEWFGQAAPVLGLPGDSEDRILTHSQQPHESFESWMMCEDALSYLPNDILVKVDRAAMSVGLETRAPFLDHRVAELAWSMPLDLKIRDSRGKWVVREVLARYLPMALFERPKMGFSVPIAAWLRGPLRDWGEALLAVDRLEHDGYLDVIPIRKRWQAHCAGTADWSGSLWSVLMFQAWLAHQSV